MVDGAVCTRCGDFLAGRGGSLCAPCGVRPKPPRPLWVPTVLLLHFVVVLGWNGFLALLCALGIVIDGVFDSRTNPALGLLELLAHIASCVVAGFLCFGSRRCARLALVAPLLTAGMVALHWASTERLREDDWVSDASIDARVFLPFVAQFLSLSRG